MLIIKQTCRLQKVRAGSRWESFRLSIPKSIVKSLNLDESELILEVVDGKVVISRL